MNQEQFKKNTIMGLIWKFLENFGTQLVNFIVQIILARILFPEDYGTIALTAVFILIAQVFIQTGFSAAIINKKDIDDDDLSTLFFAGIGLALFIYGLVFFSSPFISEFYGDALLNDVLRIQSILIILGALSSVQNAYLIRKFQFKKSFIYRMIAVIFQGIVGIGLALNGFGVWSIVYSNLVNAGLIVIFFWFLVPWKPRFVFSIQKFKHLFAYSSRILMTSLVNTLYNNIQSLLIGRRYSTESLGYYNRGYQIPMLIMVNTDGAINSVMFASMSKVQGDKEKLLSVYRRSIKSSVFIIFPMMVGLIAVAEPLTILLLTEKWIDSVPFIQLISLICMTWPFGILYQVLNADNKEKLSFRLNLIAKMISLGLMIYSIQFGIYTFVFSTFVGQVISIIIGMFVARKHYEYKIKSQIIDFLPSLMSAVVMGVIVYLINAIALPIVVILGIQVFVGIITYIAVSAIINLEALKYLYDSGLSLLKKKQQLR